MNAPMQSSQIPPQATSREPGFVRAWKNPSGNPLSMFETLVEPSRSAAAAMIAPLGRAVDVSERIAERAAQGRLASRASDRSSAGIRSARIASP